MILKNRVFEKSAILSCDVMFWEKTREFEKNVNFSKV